MATVGRRRYTTESGSVYTIDFNNKTWERQQGKEAATLRSDSGKYYSFSIDNGIITMLCPPFIPKPGTFVPRLISSTLIVKVEDLDDIELPIERSDSNESN